MTVAAMRTPVVVVVMTTVWSPYVKRTTHGIYSRGVVTRRTAVVTRMVAVVTVAATTATTVITTITAGVVVATA
jgi:hypothetical protein